jgi:L-ascorbate 6-phosphate lactonase
VIALDPYLTDSCRALGEQAGFNFARQIPPPLLPADLVGVDLYVMTHSHQDHFDPETVAGYRAAGGHGPYVAPPETIEKLQAMGVPAAEAVMVWPNKTYRVQDLTLQATFAIPFAGDDLTHVGYLLSVLEGPTVYFTGDTAYHELLAIAVRPHQPEVLVTVINGAFRNLGPAEAAKLAEELKVKAVIPCHHDLFHDNCQPAQMLHTNLKIHGMGDQYKPLEHGCSFDYARS